jgi:hypothetical protein
VLVHLPWLGPPTEVADDGDPGSRVLVSAAVATVLLPFSIVLVRAAVAWLMNAKGDPSASSSDSEARGTGTSDAMTAERERWRDVASAFFPAFVVIALLSCTVVGLPVALWLIVRFQFLPQVTMLEGCRGRRALGRSSELVRGRWLHTAVITALVWPAVQGVGVVVGLLLLVAFTGLRPVTAAQL